MVGPQIERPEWVPEWIWEKYLQIKQDYDGQRYPESSTKMLDKIFGDPRCAVVWNAMTRRRGDEFKERIGFQKEIYSDWDDIKMCLIRIPVMASGLTEEDKVPSAERAKQGTRIARLAQELRNALMEARLSTGWPNPLSSDFGLKVAKLGMEDFHDPMSTRAINIFSDPSKALDDLCDDLTALNLAAESWSSWKSLVAQPESPNADRLHFIRWMTDFFRRMYGLPLREPVAALANVLFDSKLSSQDVAKLAP